MLAQAAALVLALLIAPAVEALVRARMVLAPRTRARRRDPKVSRATVCVSAFPANGCHVGEG